MQENRKKLVFTLEQNIRRSENSPRHTDNIPEETVTACATKILGDMRQALYVNEQQRCRIH